jgi:hypothetical protein
VAEKKSIYNTGTILLAVTIIISNFHDKMFAASKQQLLDRVFKNSLPQV